MMFFHWKCFASMQFKSIVQIQITVVNLMLDVKNLFLYLGWCQYRHKWEKKGNKIFIMHVTWHFLYCCVRNFSLCWLNTRVLTDFIQFLQPRKSSLAFLQLNSRAKFFSFPWKKWALEVILFWKSYLHLFFILIECSMLILKTIYSNYLKQS